MRSDIKIEHVFVEFIPETLNENTLYVSVPYATASHKCFCGCGHDVVTPITPTDWCLIFDGETVSLDPSIGNWDFECQSHYWIIRDTVKWAAHIPRAKVEEGRQLDQLAKKRYFEHSPDETSEEPSPLSPQHIWSRFKRYW